MQKALKDLEKQLDKLLGKGSPYQMTEKSRRSLASAAWAIALVIGIVQAWSALAFWQLGHVTVSQYIPGTAYSVQPLPYAGTGVEGLNFFFYLSSLLLLTVSLLLLLATPQLKDFRRRGWELSYYALLLNLVYAFVRIFSVISGGFGQFVVALFFSAVTGYFLFQIKDTFTRGGVKMTQSSTKHATLSKESPHKK